MPQPNRYIENLNIPVHGGPDYSELSSSGFTADKILDFSVNSNPYGPAPGIKRYIYNTNIDIYPDSNSTSLLKELADFVHVSPDHILAGSGSTELIRIIASAYIDTGDHVLIPQPTYGEYELSSKIFGASIESVNIKEAEDFQLNVDDLIQNVQKIKAKAVFLCNPNNPTGQYLSQQQVENILTNLPDTLVVLDEAYIAFTENAWKSIDLIHHNNLVILRSMTKDFGLAGIRLGYLLASPEIISLLKKVKPPWNVSAFAQKAGIYSILHNDYVKKCEQKITKAKNYLIKQLSLLGMPCVQSRTNFFLVKAGNAAQMRQKLFQKGIQVRDCTSFGLTEYIRISPRSLPQCRILIKAIKDLNHAG